MTLHEYDIVCYSDEVNHCRNYKCLKVVIIFCKFVTLSIISTSCSKHKSNGVVTWYIILNVPCYNNIEAEFVNVMSKYLT